MYNRLFTKILDSSIWLEADATRIVWITLLAAMDEDGYAPFSCNENLAHRANVPMDGLKSALKVLESPDRFNPDDEFQGRRIERVAGGWLVLKAPYYRSILSREIAREQNRFRVAKHREKSSQNVTSEPLQNVTTITSVTRNAAEHNITEQKQSRREEAIPKHLSDVLEYATHISLSEPEAQKFYDHFTSNGWKVGGKAPMRNWKAALRNWKANSSQLPKSKPKEPAPFYPQLPPKREPTEEEFKHARDIAQQEIEKLRQKLRSA